VNAGAVSNRHRMMIACRGNIPLQDYPKLSRYRESCERRASFLSTPIEK
jgi:hypothetical protein